MNNANWPQEINSTIGEVKKKMEEAISISISNSDDHSSDNHSCSKAAVLLLERKQQQQQQEAKPQKDHQANLNCPRCSSTNTKFCYYNNYSLTQPRYFCKTCRRYWTEGGTLRNVPVGGGSRKNKRSINTTSSFSSSFSSSSSFKTTTHLPDLNPPPPPPFLSHFSSQNPIRTTIHEPHDLSLAFSLPPPYYHGLPHFAHEFPKINNSSSSSSSSSTTTTTTTTTTNSSSSCSSSSSFVPTAPMPDSSNSSTIFTSGFPALQEFKVPHLSFSAHLHGVVDHDHHHHHHHHHRHQQQQQNNISTSGRVFFPFGEVKQLPITTTSIGVIGHEFSGNNNNNNNNNNNKGPGSSATAAYWNNGMFGSGGGGGTW